MRINLANLVFLLVAGCGDNGVGSDQLVRVDPELQGENCEFGGIVVQTGTDFDQDDVLDDNEITSTNYVCSGSKSVKCREGASHDGSVSIATEADFAQLEGVNCIDGDLIIAGTGVAELPSMATLRTVTGAVIIASNLNLESLNGLGGLRQVGISYLVQGNEALTDISSLATLEQVSTVTLVGNDSLVDLTGLASLRDLRFDFSITNNANLQSLHGLEQLATATRPLRIRANHNLADVSALANLGTISFLEISGNPSLQTLDLSKLARVDVRVIANDNVRLEAVRFPALVTSGDGTYFNSNTALRRIEMPALIATGWLQVTSSPSLTHVSAPRLTYLSSHLELAYNSVLTTVELGELTQVGGTLTLRSVPGIVNLTGLSSLNTIHGAMHVVSTGITDFSGLSSLTTVASDLNISSNASLSGFGGLSSMTEVGGNLTISNNSALSPSVAQNFASQLTVDGTTTIN